jgi:hypothetical protein
MLSLSKLRKQYIHHPTRAALRLYLIAKARRGRYDERMFRYYGVDPHVNDGCRRFVARGYADGLVPTSSRRWPVGTNSYHNMRNANGDGKAVDMGLIERHIGTRYGRDKMVRFQRAEEAAFARGHRDHMIELIGPDNDAVVLDGRQTNLVEGTPLENQHDNHVHGAFER